MHPGFVMIVRDGTLHLAKYSAYLVAGSKPTVMMCGSYIKGDRYSATRGQIDVDVCSKCALHMVAI